MTITFEATQKGYRALWDRAAIKPGKLAMAHAAAAKIIAHRAIYEDIEAAVGGSVPWFEIGALHYRESDCDFSTYLGNGQSLGRVTTIVPKNRGPFFGSDAFRRGAIDSLETQGFTKIKSASVERVLYESEEYNGWGYTFHDENSPYVWAGTTLEQPGMYDRDGHYVAGLQDPRCGVAAIIKAIALQDAAVAAFCDPTKENPVPTQAPWPPPHPSTPPTSPSVGGVIHTTEGHIMVDVTKIEQEINVALDVTEKVLPWLSMLLGPGAAPVIALLMKVISGARVIEKQLGIPTSVAVASADAHNTPGAPNSAALSG